MAKSVVTRYTCDGCRASTVVPPEQSAPGFHSINFPSTNREVWLCGVCYRAVEWVVSFQRITRPPRVFVSEGRYGLRRRDDS